MAVLWGVAVQGPSKQRDDERLAGNVLLLARRRRGWTQHQLADVAGVPVSTVSRIETGARQPSLVTLSRLLAAAGLELRHSLEDYDDHDDVLDARRAALTDEQRDAADAAFSRTSALLTASRGQATRRQSSADPAGAAAAAAARSDAVTGTGDGAAHAELDAERILGVLERHRVNYVVVGGFAAELHGSVRRTVDVDAVPETTRENLVRLSSALSELGTRTCSGRRC